MKTATPRDSGEAFWNDAKALMIREEPSDKRVYDLEERTARFGEAVIDFARAIPQDAVRIESSINSWEQRPASGQIMSNR